MRLFRRRRYRTGSAWALWRWTDVVHDDVLYLRRLHLIQVPRVGAIMLHWIKKPDPQIHLHDHPVSFLSIPVWGWYIEEVVGPKGIPTRISQFNLGFPGGIAHITPVHRVRRWWSFVPATKAHRIISTSPGGVVTLVFAGPKVREWGFYAERGWTPWTNYNWKLEKEAFDNAELASRGIPPAPAPISPPPS
jgi:hypothetical protein